MAALTFIERRLLERVLGMSSGYVLNFSNTTFANFVTDSVQRDIYDAKYDNASGSKANRLRAFWDCESGPLVARLLEALFVYVESELDSWHWLQDADKEEKRRQLIPCREIAERLRQASPVAEIDALAQIGDEADFELVAQAVREAIEKNQPVLGLDRLHTFTTKFLRKLCAAHGLASSRDEPLNSIYGKYVKMLRDGGRLESKMTASILKSVHGPLEEFNKVRNDHSLAHDNALLNHEEALLIFNHVTSSLRFLRDLEARLAKRTAAASIEERDDLVNDSDIPF